MHTNKYILLIVLILYSFFGCSIFDHNNTSHPNEGGINLEVDWSDTAGQPLSSYRAQFVATSGETRAFNLNDNNKLLLVMPGEGMLYVYNEAENISISGNKVSVTGDQSPGLFYSYSSPVFTERDQDISHTAIMRQQTGELKIAFAIKPAGMISMVKSVTAVLEGVYSELDMQTNALSAPSSVHVAFAKSAYYATALVRTLGFDTSGKQSITLEIELENGVKANATSDLTSLVSGFNQSKNTLLALNAELFISNEKASVVTVDKWERNTELRYLSVLPSEIEWDYRASNASIEVVTDQPSWTYSVTAIGDWLTAEKTDTQLTLSAAENQRYETREATILIAAGGLNESVTVVQDQSTAFRYSDKETVKLHSATVGKGVNIIMMGDGYTVKDMNKGTGKYEQDMRKATETFFSVYPYNKYRDHFNVYMVAAISNREGISNESTGLMIDNKFKTVWAGKSTLITCDDDIVVEYVDAISDLTTVNIHDLTVIMPINANIYAGTCNMWIAYQNFGNGFSISMCPIGNYFEEIIMHEAGGHGFAKLADEYYANPTYYHPYETIPDDDRDDINYVKKFGGYENIDLYGDIILTSWKGFSDLSKYQIVGTFEGAYTYGKGIWRPEYNSCMNNNIPYFNAPSRWAQVRRIKKLAGLDYSFSQFLQDDIIPAYPATTRRYDDKTFIPLAPPVINYGEIRRIK